MKKRIVLMVFCVLMFGALLVFSGCGGGGSSSSSGSTQTAGLSGSGE